MLQKIRENVVVSKKCLRNIWLVLKLPTEEQLLEMGKMFPNLDKDIISSVFVEKSGSQEEVINVLLQMSSEWIWVFVCFCLFLVCKDFIIRFDFICTNLHYLLLLSEIAWFFKFSFCSFDSIYTSVMRVGSDTFGDPIFQNGLQN